MIIEIKSCRECKAFQYVMSGLWVCLIKNVSSGYTYKERPWYIQKDCPLRKHEVKGKKEGDA
jgi:hypothetical protein